MQSIKVWDILVRVCHWSLASAIVANWWFTEEGSQVHRYVGYTAVGIVVVRLLWGFVGTKYARFGDFFPTPSRIKHHVHGLINRQPEHTIGHNPLGALMMFALWAVVLGLGVSGYMMGTDEYFGEEWVQELHEFLANGLMVLVALHVVSAIVMSKLERVNLVRAMITGNKNFDE